MAKIGEHLIASRVIAAANLNAFVLTEIECLISSGSRSATRRTPASAPWSRS